MKEVMNYIIGGTVALLVLYSLSTQLQSFYADAEESFATENPEIAAILGLTLVIFFISVVWKLYQTAVN